MCFGGWVVRAIVGRKPCKMIAVAVGSPVEVVLAFHAGHALAELGSWLLAADGADSLGPWSIVVIFAWSSGGHDTTEDPKQWKPDRSNTPVRKTLVPHNVWRTFSENQMNV